MRVRCIATTGARLPPAYFAVGYTPTSTFPVKEGVEYSVYGICAFPEGVSYLVVSDGAGPDWCPAPLFDITDHRLPATWFYAYWGETALTHGYAIWGYEELLADSHYMDLVERKVEALKIFWRRKRETDEALRDDSVLK